MTIVNQTGYVTLYLDGPDNKTLSVRLSNVKPTAEDVDVYAVIQSVAGLLGYPLQNSLRVRRAEIND